MSNFIKEMQRKVAVAAVGSGALRGRPSGTIKKTQEFCAKLPLQRFAVASNSEFFSQQLDYYTRKLLRDVPGLREKKDWGGARKALNLFFRDAINNRFLYKEFRLKRIEPWAEIPLDRLVAGKLIEHDKALRKWSWKSIKSLEPKASETYQESALRWAKELNRHRVHLDMKLWIDTR